ncbi:MAG TPA: hypothetical protein VLC91_04240 [Spongiibacteraceae bacterium]|nr:hypothetical protein [Spongiibacteraceae bacterium]
MIGILDQIEVSAAQLAAVQNLLVERYLPGALTRGMTLTRSWVAPPVAVPGAPNTLWILWELPDIGAWWRMRARAGADPALVTFWAEVDRLCVKRQRHYLIDNDLQGDSVLPAPLPLTGVASIGSEGARESAQLFLKKNAASSDIAALETALRAAPQHIEGLRRVFLARNSEGSFGAGDYTWDADFIDAAARANAMRSNYQQTVLQPLLVKTIEREWRMGAQLIGGGLRAPALQNCIKRTAYFRLLPNAPAAVAAQLEAALLQMPAYMPGMTNWRLSRALDSEWTYIWEQEYARLDDLLGEYMVHPFHWAYIDPWFDAEFSRQIIATQLSHAFCPATDSVLAWGI